MIELLDGGAYYFTKVAVKYGGRIYLKPGDIILGYINDEDKQINVLTLMRRSPEEGSDERS